VKTEKEIQDKLEYMLNKKWYQKLFYPYGEYRMVVRVLRWVLE